MQILLKKIRKNSKIFELNIILMLILKKRRKRKRKV